MVTSFWIAMLEAVLTTLNLALYLTNGWWGSLASAVFCFCCLLIVLANRR